MVFGPLMDKVDVVLQRVDITAVIERHEQHNVIGIQVEFALDKRGTLEMESMKMMKSKSPNMEPWGTPDVTGVGGEEEPSRTTLCSLPER